MSSQDHRKDNGDSLEITSSKKIVSDLRNMDLSSLLHRRKNEFPSFISLYHTLFSTRVPARERDAIEAIRYDASRMLIVASDRPEHLNFLVRYIFESRSLGGIKALDDVHLHDYMVGIHESLFKFETVPGSLSNGTETTDKIRGVFLDALAEYDYQINSICKDSTITMGKYPNSESRVRICNLAFIGKKYECLSAISHGADPMNLIVAKNTDDPIRERKVIMEMSQWSDEVAFGSIDNMKENQIDDDYHDKLRFAKNISAMYRGALPYSYSIVHDGNRKFWINHLKNIRLLDNYDDLWIDDMRRQKGYPTLSKIVVQCGMWDEMVAKEASIEAIGGSGFLPFLLDVKK